jgi:hypothetical protein
MWSIVRRFLKTGMLRLVHLTSSNSGEHGEAPPFAATGRNGVPESTAGESTAQPRSPSTAKSSGFAARREQFTTSLPSK